MNGAEALVRDDEFDAEPELPESLNPTEIEELERLTYGCRSVQFKKEKILVDARRGINWISFAAANGNTGVQISFVYDVQNGSFSTLQGADVEWVREFLRKYRIIED